MKYLWTEDTGAGLHFWKLVNQLFFDDALVVESKESNQGLLDALAEIDMKEDDKYYMGLCMKWNFYLIMDWGFLWWLNFLSMKAQIRKKDIRDLRTR